MITLSALLAFLILAQPFLSAANTGTSILGNADKLYLDVHNWRLQGCPYRTWDGYLVYGCKRFVHHKRVEHKKLEAVDKKHVKHVQ
jgi:hypothetical protein